MGNSYKSLEPTWMIIIRLLRWDKPAGRLILMIPALWALVLAAKGFPPLILVGTIALGSIATSSAGCVINDIWDRNLDAQVERTKNRPLASKVISVKLAIAVGIVFLAISLICALILILYLKPISFWLSVAALPFIICYPLAKRFFPIPQLVLALTWGFAVLISWTAITGKIEIYTLILWLATVSWTLGFDTIYAMRDRQDDKKAGIFSSALFFGKFAPEAITFFNILAAILLAVLGEFLHLNRYFWLAWFISAAIWIAHYFRLKSFQISFDDYGAMFSENVIIGFILLLGMIAGFSLK